MSNGRTSYESPQMRRLKHDQAAMERLRDESSVLRFRAFSNPAQRYLIEFSGRSLAREKGKVVYRDTHEVEIKLGVSYPRTMPELRWLTPIYHPNISEIGMVCLGGYGTHWVPSLHLDDLVGMLWDMARYFNYDIRSPYNRDAALWAANQTTFPFPTDNRPLRDVRIAQGRIETEFVALPDLIDAPAPIPMPAPAPPKAVEAPATAVSNPAPRAAKPDDTIELCILDVEIDLRPHATPPAERPARLVPPRPAPQNEVFFID